MARVFGGRLRVQRDMLSEDDLATAEPTDNGGLTTGKTVTLGAGSDSSDQQQEAPTVASQVESASSSR